MVPSAHEGDQPVNAVITDELARLASFYDFTPLSGLMLRSGSETVAVDHAIVDRFGILVISVMTCRDAFVRGSESDARWTVRFEDGTISTLVNPLLNLRIVERVAGDIARESRNPLEADYVKSAVVFDSCGLEGLDLGPFDRERVITAGEIESLLSLRNDFAPNPGDVDASTRTSLVMALRSADRATSESGQTPLWAVDHEAAALNERALTQGARRAAASAAVVESPKKRSTLGRNIYYVITRLTPVLLAVLAWWWVMYGGGMEMVVARVESMTLPEDSVYSVTAADPTSHQVVDNIPVVVERLKKDAPAEVVASIADINHPKISKAANGVIVYRWAFKDSKGKRGSWIIRTTLEGDILASSMD